VQIILAYGKGANLRGERKLKGFKKSAKLGSFNGKRNKSYVRALGGKFVFSLRRYQNALHFFETDAYVVNKLRAAAVRYENPFVKIVGVINLGKAPSLHKLSYISAAVSTLDIIKIIFSHTIPLYLDYITKIACCQ
jgi:hypothetical protein